MRLLLGWLTAGNLRRTSHGGPVTACRCEKQLNDFADKVRNRVGQFEQLCHFEWQLRECAKSVANAGRIPETQPKFLPRLTAEPTDAVTKFVNRGLIRCTAKTRPCTPRLTTFAFAGNGSTMRNWPLAAPTMTTQCW